MRPVSRRALLQGVGALAALPAGDAWARGVWPPTPIAVQERPVSHFALFDRDRSRFGPLVFLGGFELRSTHHAFGGFSGLAATGGDGLLVVSDNGSWLSLQLRSAPDGRPLGVADAVIAPMLDAGGVPLGDTKRYDTEGLALIDGTAYVGIERTQEVMRFPFGRDGLRARGRMVPVPAGMAKWPSNRGPEAIGILPAGPLAGSLIVIAEQSQRGADTPTEGFFVTGPQRGAFRVARHDSFDITDIAFLPGGDMLVLERHFSWLSGVAMRLRRVALASIQPGALLTGERLLEADMRFHIDNMEGLCVQRAADGSTLLTMISDDNFSALQRTVLLRFRYEG
jgi:hypothetical protein